jgi:hypothetical protein
VQRGTNMEKLTERQMQSCKELNISPKELISNISFSRMSAIEARLILGRRARKPENKMRQFVWGLEEIKRLQNEQEYKNVLNKINETNPNFIEDYIRYFTVSIDILKLN